MPLTKMERLPRKPTRVKGGDQGSQLLKSETSIKYPNRGAAGYMNLEFRGEALVG